MDSNHDVGGRSATQSPIYTLLDRIVNMGALEPVGLVQTEAYRLLVEMCDPPKPAANTLRACASRLSDMGYPRPRTCGICGLGPCTDRPSTPTDDGGPAHPVQDAAAWQAHGMTLRDVFAGQAMQGALSDPKRPNFPSNAALARTAYQVADAMLKARREA